MALPLVLLLLLHVSVQLLFLLVVAFWLVGLGGVGLRMPSRAGGMVGGGAIQSVWVRNLHMPLGWSIKWQTEQRKILLDLPAPLAAVMNHTLHVSYPIIVRTHV